MMKVLSLCSFTTAIEMPIVTEMESISSEEKSIQALPNTLTPTKLYCQNTFEPSKFGICFQDLAIKSQNPFLEAHCIETCILQMPKLDQECLTEKSTSKRNITND